MGLLQKRRPHVLLIARYFPPSVAIGGRRAQRFARGLSARGFRVSVLTVEERFFETVDLSLLDDTDGHYDILTTRCYAPAAWLNASRKGRKGVVSPVAQVTPSGSTGLGKQLLSVGARFVRSVMRPDENLGWVLPATRAAVALHSRTPIDFVIPSMPPYSSLITAASMVRRTGATLIADYRDPWAADREIWLTRPGLKRWFDDKLEHRLLRRAALVIFTSSSAQEFYREHFPDLRRTETLLNGIDAYVQRTESLRPPPLTWVHAGSTHGGRRSFGPLLRTMARLREEVPMRLVLIGDEPRADLALADCLGIRDRVDWRGPLPLRDTLRELRISHRLVAVISADHAFSVPGKIFDYFSTSRPILLLADPRHAAARIVATIPQHRTVAPEREDELEALVRADHAAVVADGLPDVAPELSRSFEAATQLDTLARWLRELGDAT